MTNIMDKHSLGIRTKLNQRKKKVRCQTNHKNISTNILKRKKMENIREPINQNTYITDLNDDCLLEIFKKLELKDQLALVESHPRFESPFEMIAKIKYKSINLLELKNKFDKFVIEKLFIFAGNYIEKLKLFRRNFDLYFWTDLTKHCKNLEVLDLSNLQPWCISKMLSNQRQLKYLYIEHCDTDDKLWKEIANLPQLEKLVFRSCDFSVCQNFMMPNLREIHLSYFNDVNSKHFENALLLMPSLNVLSINGIKKIRLGAKKLSQVWNNLEVLNLDCARVSSELVAQLTKVKKISLDGAIAISLLKQLAQERPNQIESLRINCLKLENIKHLISEFKNLKHLRIDMATDDFLTPLHSLQDLEKVEFQSSRAISNQGLLNLLKCCINLKHVNIEGTRIDNDFAENLLPLLKQEKRPNGLLTFFVCCSNIKKENLPKKYTTGEFIQIVRFVFEPARTPSEWFW